MVARIGHFNSVFKVRTANSCGIQRKSHSIMGEYEISGDIKIIVTIISRAYTDEPLKKRISRYRVRSLSSESPMNSLVEINANNRACRKLNCALRFRFTSNETTTIILISCERLLLEFIEKIGIHDCGDSYAIVKCFKSSSSEKEKSESGIFKAPVFTRVSTLFTTRVTIAQRY